MYRYSTSQLAIITAVPTVTVLLLWTLAIFYKNKKQWRPYDICIVAILIQSVLRNLSTLAYTVLTILSQTNEFSNEYCTTTIWLFNSLHTFQASTLSTLSVVGLYVIKLSKKQKEIKQYLTTTHIIYHLFCLTTLCACVGVAAILARRDSLRKSANFDLTYPRNSSYESANSFENCHFMPYELDIKYNIFILSLHCLLALVSILCFLCVLITFYQCKKNGFDYLKKSTSDLSDLSLGAAASTVSQKDDVMTKNYYDTYQKQQESNYIGPNRQDGVYTTGTKQEPWNSDTSNISTSVSSTNSRRPCLLKHKKDDQGAGMETIMPILIVCYLFNHLPVVVVCVFPWLPTPWTNGAGAALWLGLAQDALMPTALGLVDGRFNSWVSKAYRCGRGGRKTQQDKPPHGLDGKFRPFTSTPQTLEVAPMVSQVRTRPMIPPPMTQIMVQNDHKFPITNGSLYTSIDGRLPIIHNYRRHKGLRIPVHSVSMGLHSTYVKRQESMVNQLPTATHFQPSEPCDDSFISLPADYTSIGSTFPDIKQPSNIHKLDITSQLCLQNHQKNSPANFKPKRIYSASQNSLSDVSIIENELRKIRLNNMCKSHNNLNEINVTQRDIQKFKINPEIYQKQNLNISKHFVEEETKEESSDDEYFNNSITYTDDVKNYDTISSQSCCSITTEANCDFEFFTQNAEKELPTFAKTEDFSESYILKLSPNKTGSVQEKFPVMRSFKPLLCKSSVTDSSTDNSNSNSENFLSVSPKAFGKNFKIRRSNSKRSLDNLDNYIKDSRGSYKMQRSNSNRSCDLLRQNTSDSNSNNKGTYVIRSNSNRSYDVMRSDPNISETNIVHRKPSVARINLRNLNSSCIHFSDKNDAYNRNVGRDIQMEKQRVSIPVLSMESLTSMLNQRGISYLDNGDICNHNYGGSVPDFKKIFVSEFI